MDGPKSPPLPEQSKMLPGHIGRTIVPGEEKENQPQAIAQPGQLFTPFWESLGVSEADLYR